MDDSGNFAGGRKVTTLDDFTVLPETASYLQSIDAKPINLRTAYINQSWLDGKYYRHWARVRFSDDGTVEVKAAYKVEISAEELANLHPSDEEQTKIKAEWASRQWPTIKPVDANDRYGTDHPPEELVRALKQANPKGEFDPKKLDYFKRPRTAKEREGRDKRDNRLLLMMVQQRIERPDGGKFYVNWSPWSDKIWRRAEPDLLPLYGLDKLTSLYLVFLHEGCNGARLMHDLAARDAWDEHPWGEILKAGCHVAWAGGAGNPDRTDFSPLNDAKIIIIVEDNDDPGRQASPELSCRFKSTTLLLQFGKEFPERHDLGDAFPDEMFKLLPDGRKRYDGPSFKSCLFPFTWLTNKFTPNKGKPIISLRPKAADEVIYVSGQDQYIFREYPWHGLYKPEALNRALARRSDTTKIEALLSQEQRYQVNDLTYRPDKPTGIVSGGLFNIHIPSDIIAKEGDPTPWFDYSNQLIPDDKERHETLRWVYTLIARPGIHMRFGLLLWSIMQQVGKSLLAELILQPLLGEGNYSNPSEEDVTGKYNDWMVNKRLVIIDEIYQGESWKVYNSFKARMTQAKFRTSIKYEQGYDVDNHAHFLANSNSRHALSIENADARWLIAHATEIRWGSEKFRNFIQWLKHEDGLAIIKQHACSRSEDFYVKAEETAPITETKRDMIRAKQKPVQGYFYDLVQYWNAKAGKEPKVTSATKLTAAVLNHFQEMKDADPGKYADLKFPTPTQLRDSIIGLGCSIWENRMDVPGGGHDTKHFILLNAEATRRVAALVNEKGGKEANAEARQLIKNWWVKPETMMELMDQRAREIKAHMNEDEPF